MSDRAWLEGHNCETPLFHVSDCKGISHQKYGLPIGWLSLFGKNDVYLLQDPEEQESYDEFADEEDEVFYCGTPTLFTTKRNALSNLRRRMKVYSGRLLFDRLPSQYFVYFLRLEQAIDRCKSNHIQIFLNEFEFWKQMPESVQELQAHIESVESCDPRGWAASIEDLTVDHRKVVFKDGARKLKNMQFNFHHSPDRPLTAADEDEVLSQIFIGYLDSSVT